MLQQALQEQLPHDQLGWALDRWEGPLPPQADKIQRLVISKVMRAPRFIEKKEDFMLSSSKA
jgi:hypothetical protein